MIAFLSQFDAEVWLRIVSIRLSGAGELGMKGVFIRSLSTLVPQPQNADDHDGQNDRFGQREVREDLALGVVNRTPNDRAFDLMTDIVGDGNEVRVEHNASEFNEEKGGMPDYSSCIRIEPSQG